jgi:hypothetical protein
MVFIEIINIILSKVNKDKVSQFNDWKVLAPYEGTTRGDTSRLK